MIRVLGLILSLFAFFANVNKLNAQSDFSAVNRKGCAPLTVQFSDLSTGSIVAWSWDLGNGNLSTLKNPSASYTTPGKFTIKLTVTDASGNKFSVTKTQFVVAYKSPIADFSGSPRTICQGETVSFSDKSTPGDTTITKYTWDMNDGTRAFTKRFNEKFKKQPPTMVQAGVYSSLIHYFKALEALGGNPHDGRAVVAKMKEMPTDDPLFGKGTIRADGRKVHPVYLVEVKKPSESKGPWDYHKVRATIPADQAFRPLAESECPLVKK